MEWTANEFGGILLKFDDGNIAINGGGSLQAVETAYIVDNKPPRAVFLTCEHYHRSHNVDRFCLKYNLPLYVSYLCAERLNLEGINTHFFDVPGSNFYAKFGFWMTSFPVRYDSIDPFFMIFNDGSGNYGFVFDGKVSPEMSKYLLDCDEIILQNIQNVDAESDLILDRRIGSVYNSQKELNEILSCYTGKIFYL